MKKLFLILFVLIFFTNPINAYPATYIITNDAYVESSNPNTNFEGTNTALLVGFWDAGTAYTYIDLGSIPDTQISLVIYEYDNILTLNNETSIYTTSSFNESNITWNNKPATIDFINSFNTELGYNYLNFTTTSRYIVLLSLTTLAFYSSEHNTSFPYAINITAPLSGHIRYTDVDNSIKVLSGAFISLNSTTNTTSDSTGFYIFNGISAGDYIINISANSSFNTLSTPITLVSGNNTQDFTLLFSKPHLTTPYINGNFLSSIYSHNFKTINLWENPNYVWGIYNFNGTIQKEICSYNGSSMFSCNLKPGTYSFNMSYSDIYNYAQIPNRTFNTPSISIADGINSIDNPFKQISLLPQIEREKESKLNFFSILYYLVIIILLIGIASLFDRDNTYRP